MRLLTMKEVNSLGELFARNLPAKAELEWEYRIYKDRQTLDFTIREKPKQDGIFAQLDKGLKDLGKDKKEENLEL